jgi:hypothetical protein
MLTFYKTLSTWWQIKNLCTPLNLSKKCGEIVKCVYIYIYVGVCVCFFFFFCFRGSAAQLRAIAFSYMRFLDHTQRRATVGRTPLDEWSARRRDLYLTTHNTHNRQTFMPPVRFEPTVSAGERPQTYTLDRAATGTGIYIVSHDRNVQWNPARKSVSVARWRVVNDPHLFTYLRSRMWRNSTRNIFCYSWRIWECMSVPMKISCKLVKRSITEWVYFLLTSLTLHFATTRKAASSIPDGVIGIFHWHDLSGSNMALGLTQPSTEISIRNISWG